MAVVLYGLGPAQLHGRLVLGCYRQQVSADQSLGSATALSPRTMLSVFDTDITDIHKRLITGLACGVARFLIATFNETKSFRFG